MSPHLMPFTYEGATIRTVVIDGEPWFVLADLCRVLGISDVSIVRRRLDDALCQAHPITDSMGRAQQATIVSEAGMYEVVIRSDKPEAVRFRRWITGTVLPEIRRTGRFNTPQHAIPATYAEALREAATQFERAEVERAARIEAEQHAELLSVPAAAWSALEDADGDYDVADAAKILSRDPAISIGRDRLFEFMGEQKWIFRGGSKGAWKAYQNQIDTGRLAEKPGGTYFHPPTKRIRKADPTIRVTAKGLAELHKRLGGGTQLALVPGGAA